jgi:acyl-CoA reductase-like NAD-dependent aldehyde dehydrogenase
MTKSEVETCCAKARKAQHSWSRTTYAQRRLVLRTIQKYILAHQEDICRVSARDSGKPKVDALLGEVMTTCEKIRCVNALGESWLQPSPRPVGPMMLHKSAHVEYVPYGVLGVIAPWNYPFHNMLNHVISGLFSGNAVVSKVSEHTAWSSQYFTKIVKAALEVNGHDSDVVQTLTGFGDCGAALVDCELVDKIIFTGSPGVGRLVMKGCSKNVKPCILELGGKDPMVFCDDVDLDVSNDVVILLYIRVMMMMTVEL